MFKFNFYLIALFSLNYFVQCFIEDLVIKQKKMRKLKMHIPKLLLKLLHCINQIFNIFEIASATQQSNKTINKMTESKCLRHVTL